MLPVSLDFIESVQGAAFSGEDVFGGLAPDEWPGLGIVLHQAVADGGLQFAAAGVTAAADVL